MYHAASHSSSSARERTERPSDKKRPRKQPPNQVWLDAIMSKTRSNEPSPSSGVVGGLSQPPLHGVAETTDHDHGHDDADWQAAAPRARERVAGPATRSDYVAPVAAARSSRSSSPALAPGMTMAPPASVAAPVVGHSIDHPFAGQLAVDDVALATAITASLKELVTEQDCSFVARGLCHLCSDKETKLVPVVNFCPDFSPTHSLCREHLRSMHRVRLVDIFAGKNQPTVSKRSLRCTVCSLSCPCSKCQLRRDVEIAKYKQWLAGGSNENGDTAIAQANTFEDDEEELPMGPRSRSRQPTPPLPPSAAGAAYDASGSRRRRDGSRHQSMAPDASDGDYAYAEEKRRSSDRPVYFRGEDKPVSDHSSPYPYEGYLPAPDMPVRADEKGSARGSRFPKRAAKESVPYALESPSIGYAPSPGHEAHVGLLGGNPKLAASMPSPSAASVLNCPDSEKSLVDLLSSLNQRVTPAVRYFADADEPGFRDMMDDVSLESDPYDRRGAAEGPRTGEFTRFAENEHEAYMRRQKRKRESVSSSKGIEDASLYGVDDDEPLRRISGSTANGPVLDRDGVPSYRQKAPTPLATGDRKSKQVTPAQAAGRTPSPSPRGRPSGRTKGTTPLAASEPKAASSRKRDSLSGLPPSAPTSTRKRKSDTLAASPAVSTERKTPRGSAHRGHAHKSSTANHESDHFKRKHAPRVSSKEAENLSDEDKDEEIEDGDGDGDDDSELDTNLDYCEVCLCAGDLVCCDVCPRSFHLKCLKKTEDDLPEGDWQCDECQKPSYFESFKVTVAEKTTVPEKCLEIVRRLKSHPFSKPFLNPVENVPHYTNIVKQPMDLSTIEKKLMDNKYMVSSKGTMQGANDTGRILHLGSFVEDVRLVWANCKLFNDDGSGITRAADQLSEGFEKLYHDVLDFIERAPAARHANGVRRDEKKPAAQSAIASESKGRDATPSAPVGHTAPKLPENKSTVPTSKPMAAESSSLQLDPKLSKVVPPAAKLAKETNRSDSNTTRATTSASVSVSVKDPKPSSTAGSTGPSTGTLGDKSKSAVLNSASTAARSASPSPITTGASTPSPTESTTTTFVQPQTKASVAVPEQTPPPVTAEKSVPENQSKATKVVEPTK